MLSTQIASLSKPDFDLNIAIMEACGCTEQTNKEEGSQDKKWWTYPSGQKISGIFPIHKLQDAVDLCEATFKNCNWYVSHNMAEVNGFISLKRGLPAVMLCHALAQAVEAKTETK